MGGEVWRVGRMRDQLGCTACLQELPHSSIQEARDHGPAACWRSGALRAHGLVSATHGKQGLGKRVSHRWLLR